MKHISGYRDENRIDEAVMTLMDRLDPDPAHALQVEHLTGSLFSALTSLHSLDDGSRRLFGYAALLHDIGWSVCDRPHHKASMDLILADDTLPLCTEDRIVVALIARYHRKSVPSPKNSVYRSLPRDRQYLVDWGSAILRVADVLDRAHDSRVDEIACIITDDQIAIRCNTNGNPYDALFMQVFSKKAEQLARVSGRDITVMMQ